MNGSVLNVVCFEMWSVMNVVCNELVCYGHGLLSVVCLRGGERGTRLGPPHWGVTRVSLFV